MIGRATVANFRVVADEVSHVAGADRALVTMVATRWSRTPYG